MITRTSIKTKNGNILELFYNDENDLVCLDLVAKNEEGGNELLRQTLDEDVLLSHC